jgi:Cof subfamily protein (haloacid dehalogenase superfamily)
MIRVIAVDLDETLLAPDKSIPEANKAALQLAVERGVRVVLATARGWGRTEAFYQELGLDTPVIVSSGSRLVDGSTGQELWLNTLPMEFARELCAFCTEQEISIRVYVGSEVWNNLPLDPLLGTRVADDHVRPHLASELVTAPYQIYAKGERNVSELLARFGGRGDGWILNVTKYADGIPEVMILNPQSTKGAALQKLCESWEIPRDQVMAIGDNYNDLSMIEWAGLGVAMGWASPEVQERADYVTPPDDVAGVARAIRYALFEHKTSSAS